MKIKLHYIQPNNYGNLMMAITFIDNFVRNFGGKEELEIVTDVENEKELERLTDSLETNYNITMDEKFLKVRARYGGGAKIFKLIVLPFEILHNIRDYDVHIVLGGDCISGYYHKARLYADMIRFKFISKRKRMYLVGQTIGPFSRRGVKIVRNALKNTVCYTRDNDCYEYCTSNMAFRKLEECADLAFLDIPFQSNKEIEKSLIKKYSLPEEYITIIVSGAYTQYTHDIEKYIDEYVRIIENLINKYHVNILMLAHVIHTEDSNDRGVMQKVYHNLSLEIKDNVCMIDELVLPYEARILLGKGLFTITGRMHGAVSSINMGVVPICLSYSVKYKGVIGKCFGLQDYILECADETMWEKHIVSREVCDIVTKLLAKKEEEERRLKSKLSGVQKKSLKQILEIIGDLNNAEYENR